MSWLLQSKIFLIWNMWQWHSTHNLNWHLFYLMDVLPRLENSWTYPTQHYPVLYLLSHISLSYLQSYFLIFVFSLCLVNFFSSIVLRMSSMWFMYVFESVTITMLPVTWGYCDMFTICFNTISLLFLSYIIICKSRDLTIDSE